MTVGELIEELKKVDKDRLVVLQVDQEGNGYEEVRGVDDNATYDENEREVRLLKLTKALEKRGFCEDDLAPEDAKPCVVLFP